jgi:DNA primase catalytic subunit
MSHNKKIQVYSESAVSLKKENFEPLVIAMDEAAIDEDVNTLKAIASKLVSLKDEIESYGNGNPIPDQELIDLISMSRERLPEELNRIYVLSNKIKIEGIDVKIDKLTELINIPDHAHIIKSIEAIKTKITYLKNDLRYSIDLDSFFSEDGIKVPEKAVDAVKRKHIKKTRSIEENHIYLAVRKILEGFSELEDSGNVMSGEGFETWATRMLRYAFTQKAGGIIDVHPGVVNTLRKEERLVY